MNKNVIGILVAIISAILLSAALGYKVGKADEKKELSSYTSDTSGYTYQPPAAAICRIVSRKQVVTKNGSQDTIIVSDGVNGYQNATGAIQGDVPADSEFLVREISQKSGAFWYKAYPLVSQ